MFHSLLLLLATPSAGTVEWAQMTIERRVIIRVPMARKAKAPPRANADAADDWDERRGPRCIALRSIRGASILVRNGVDLLLADDHRYRARLQKGCDSASFYSGFYVEPHEDGSLCSGRDELQARSGTSCAINDFRRLIAADDDD